MSNATQPKKFWSVPTHDLFAQLRSSPQGLTTAEAQARRAAQGRASKQRHAVAGWPMLLLSQFKSPLVLLLLFAMVLSLALGETGDALIVLSVVLLSGLLGFYQENRASNTIAALLAIVKTQARVLRNSVSESVPAGQVVAGDIVLLSAGDAIPADCVLLEATDVYVDESALTGESYPAEKGTALSQADAPLAVRNNALFQGTHVISGMARALVVHTGDATEFGHIQQRLRRPAPETEFEHGIRMFGNLLIKITIVMVISIFAINVYFQKPVISSLLFALALAVGLTPELLPAIVSITLANGAQRMAKKKVIVKRLAAIENFGSMNVLCSDKTGTLTQGLMQIRSALDATGQVSERVLLHGFLNASLQTGFANPIDAALTKLTEFDDVRGAYLKTDEVPYDFLRKRLSVVVAHEQRHVMITKGAVQNVLDVCASAEMADGLQAMPVVRSHIEAHFETYSKAGARVLGVAIRDVTGDPVIDRDDETAMTFIGFLLFEDPLKPDAAETLLELGQLGISLKIITGDNRHIAANVAAKLGIAPPTVVTGTALTQMTDEALRVRVMQADIFAEIEPNQKERIILALRQAGNVVGYIGDGINDAAALHVADVGISVEGAVDVAKEAADIVLLERDLKVLTAGVRDGRVTFANTLKYIFTTTSANFGNMFSMAGVSLFLPFLPLLPKQILLNNFLSDLPSMTIATDTVDHEMVDTPHRWDIKFIQKFMITFGLISSVFDFLTFGTLLFVLNANESQFRTGWFMESLMTELFITVVVRTRRPFFRSRPSRWLMMAVLLVAGVTLVLPYTALGAVFGLVPLPAAFMFSLAAITGLYLIASELAKKWFYAHIQQPHG